jgi:hypothetical protein
VTTRTGPRLTRRRDDGYWHRDGLEWEPMPMVTEVVRRAADSRPGSRTFIYRCRRCDHAVRRETSIS